MCPNVYIRVKKDWLALRTNARCKDVTICGSVNLEIEENIVPMPILLCHNGITGFEYGKYFQELTTAMGDSICPS